MILFKAILPGTVVQDAARSFHWNNDELIFCYLLNIIDKDKT